MKYNWDLNKILELVKTSINFSEVLDGLNIPRRGNNSKTLRNILDKNNIDYSHFTGRAREYKRKTIPLNDYLDNLKSINTYKLKDKLISTGLKENKCEICGITEWLGKPIVCQLHHINGDHNDNRLENLLMLCPNCHSQTDNYCGNAKEKQHYYCIDCGKEITRSAKYCTCCAAKHHRKVERPIRELLILDFKELKSFSGIGRKYGVTDNSVRKWFVKENLPNASAEMKRFINN